MRSQDPSAAAPEQAASRNGQSPEEPRSVAPAPLAEGARGSKKERKRRRGVPTARSVREDYGEVLNFCQFPSERRLPILQDMRATGGRRGLDPAILQGIDDAIRFEERLHDREAAWAGREERAFREGAREAAGRVERSLSSFFRILESMGESLPAGQPKKEAADRLRTALFPNGVGAIAKQAYTIEHAFVGELLKRAGREENARDLALLGLQAQVDHLAALHEEFGEALRLSKPLEHDEMQRLRFQGQQLLNVLIVRVMGVHHGADPESCQLREDVLRAVLFHDDQIRQGFRRRATKARSADTSGEAEPASS